jgi:hypothetical protein
MINYLIGRDEHPKDNKWDKCWTTTSKSRCRDVAFLDDRRVLRVSGLKIGNMDLLTSAADCDRPALPPHPIADSLQSDEPELLSDRSELITLPTLDNGNLVYHWLMQHRSFEIAGRTLSEWSRDRGIDFLDRLGHHSRRLLVRAWHDEPFHLRRTQTCDAISRVLDDGLRLRTTDTGHIGWAHPRARKGDQVFMLQGCSMPVILRPAPEWREASPTFTVIGNAFVHAGMYGELWVGEEDNLQHLCLV